jgi:hypothetical protein
VHYESQVTPVFARYLYRPVIRAAEWLADVVRPLQSGDVNLYLFYVFAMLLVAYLLGAIGPWPGQVRPRPCPLVPNCAAAGRLRIPRTAPAP